MSIQKLTRRSSEPKKAHLTSEFVVVAKFGDHVLHNLASSVSNVVRHVDMQADVNSSLGDFLRIQYFTFGNYLIILNAMFGCGNAKTIL